jgi:hypothetical protein
VVLLRVGPDSLEPKVPARGLNREPLGSVVPLGSLVGFAKASDS